MSAVAGSARSNTRFATVAFAAVVAAVLADSSVVTIALPEILARYNVSVGQVAWVLIAYNAALALLAFPGARLAERAPRRTIIVGLAVFSAASVACAIPIGFGGLLAARAIQAVGGAMILGAALLQLKAVIPDERRAVGVWTSAGILGAAVGPAIGGLLTQGLGWESIFLLQAPIPLVALVFVRQVAPGPRHAALPVDRTANGGLLAMSAALSAALFLLAILLIIGWRIPAAGAGAVMTIMPIAAIATERAASGRGTPIGRATPGAILVAGGLASLALLPSARWAWTILPQVAIGVGLGLCLAALTQLALARSGDDIGQAGWTMAARHAGVVVGLALLTPLFSADLARNTQRAIRAGTAVVLESDIPPGEQIATTQRVLAEIDRSDGRLPDVKRAIAETDRGATPAYRALGRALEDQLDRAATRAFSRAFFAASMIALLALVPLLLSRSRP
ncbi:MAG: MFS transporter [Actinobacteria bacterium]|nr:MFS transporter [Actinomycetota bacterium]